MSTSNSQAAAALDQLLETVHTLVWPSGCAWHEAQTHASLTPFLVEETAEVIEVIDADGPADELLSELGDVLYQVLFHAAIAERDGEGFGMTEVMTRLNDKLVNRHPHVFGDRGYMSVDELNAEWEQLKEDAEGSARGSRGPLEGIPTGMPTLARAAKTVERLKRADLIDPQHYREAELDEQVLGDNLLELVIQANAAGIDPDRSLRLALDRFANSVMKE